MTRLTARSGERLVSPAWAITARVKEAFLNLPPWIDCGQLHESTGDAGTTSFVVESVTPIRDLVAAVEPELARATVEPVDPTGCRHRVTVRPAVRILGERVAVLRLTATSASGEVLPPRRTRIVYQVVTDVQPSVRRLLLGSVEAGQSTSDVVAFRSLTGRPLVVDAPTRLPPGITVERHQGAHTPAFTLTACGTGGNLLPLDFRVRQPGREPYVVRVEVAFHAAEPVVSPRERE